jgi:hypothetical protein
MKEVNEGVFFHTVVKSQHNKYTQVFIPKMNDIMFSPYHCTHQFIETSKHISLLIQKIQDFPLLLFKCVVIFKKFRMK